jgi:hypothetical protein
MEHHRRLAPVADLASLGCMTHVIQKTPPAFLALSVATPAAALLLVYGTYHWDESALFACLLLGADSWVTLLGWSLWSIRRHRSRAIAGSLICAYSLWQAMQIMSKW